MKKVLSLLLAVLLFAGALTGCNQQQPTSVTLGNDINSKLDKLSSVVAKLDTIDNEYIASPDIFPTGNVAVSLIVPNPNFDTPVEFHEGHIESNAIANTTIDTNELIRNLLIQKLTDKLKCDSNGNCYICGQCYGDCDNNICQNCGNCIVCDNNGNCTNCGKTLQLDRFGNCTNCNKSCTGSSCNNINYSSFNNACKNCADSYKNLLEVNRVSLDNDDETINLEDTSVSDDTLNSDTTNTYIDTNLDQYDQDMQDGNNSPKIYYYYEEQSFTPENLKYKPRYVSDAKIQEAKDNLNSYVIKIQKLYAMTADVIEANDTLQEFKNNVINSINDTKAINANYRNLNLTPTIYQANTINNYLHDIDRTTSYLRQANGTLNNEVNNINRTNNTGVANSIDVMNSNYLRLLNHIDLRITYHELALSTLDQLKIYLLDSINNSNYDQLIDNDNAVVEDNEDYNDQDVIINEDNQDIDNVAVDDNAIIDDNNNSAEDNTNFNDNQNENDDYINSDEQNLETSTDTNNYSDEATDVIIDDNDNYSDDIIVEENIDDNNLDETEGVADNIDDNRNEFGIVPNIDTYVNDTTNNNTNTYNDNVNYSIIDNNNYVEENALFDNNINNNDNFINDNPVDDVILNNNNAYNNYGNNAFNNKKFANEIINENNLNTDGNVTNNNGYVYDENGRLYNTNTNNLTNGRHNNLNTYEYNTLIDGINQGTIDNGINNL